jgi:hypothetical protein
MAQRNFTSLETRIICYIVGNTYLQNRKESVLSNGTIAEGTGVARHNVVRCLTTLSDMGIVSKEILGGVNYLGIVPNSKKWKTQDHKEPLPAVRFVKPSPVMVTEYARSRGHVLDGQEFCDFYESKAWMVGKNPMKDWQAAVRTWVRRHNGRGPQSLSPTQRAMMEAHRLMGGGNEEGAGDYPGNEDPIALPK